MVSCLEFDEVIFLLLKFIFFFQRMRSCQFLTKFSYESVLNSWKSVFPFRKLFDFSISLFYWNSILSCSTSFLFCSLIFGNIVCHFHNYEDVSCKNKFFSTKTIFSGYSLLNPGTFLWRGNICSLASLLHRFWYISLFLTYLWVTVLKKTDVTKSFLAPHPWADACHWVTEEKWNSNFIGRQIIWMKFFFATVAGKEYCGRLRIIVYIQPRQVRRIIMRVEFFFSWNLYRRWIDT